jgi:hypothetical protein
VFVLSATYLVRIAQDQGWGPVWTDEDWACHVSVDGHVYQTGPVYAPWWGAASRAEARGDIVVIVPARPADDWTRSRLTRSRMESFLRDQSR